MTHEEVEELVARRVAEEMEARKAARNLETLNENEEEQEGKNRGNKNGGNGENGNHGMNYGGFMPMARECTFQYFLKCKPHTFSGTEGVVGLTRWFEKMETVFNISNCPPKYQVKYATCTLQNSALTWWNSHKRTIESYPSEDPSLGHIPPLPAVSPFLSSDDDTTDTPGQPIPHGRPYRYHPHGSVHMMTARKRVRQLPVQQLSVRHSVDHSSSDSSSRHSSSDYSSLDLPSTFAGPSRKRRRSPMTSVPALPLIFGALSHVRADLIPPPKRVRDIGYLADVEVDPRETRDERVTHPAMPEDIIEPAQEGAAEVTYETLGDLVQRFHDHTQAIPVHRIQTIEGVKREQGHRIVGVESIVTALTERVAELERDNQRLRGTASVES
nr:putative reverse transcriptase domain-containing protein [Tanacetum cinerariifolium]